jgi:DNA primase large subunit
VLSTFLINVGMPVDQIVDLFANTPNFNAKKTQYYVEYSAGKRGSGVKYTPPSCKKMEFYGLCKGKDALCAGIGHPLSRYARKGRARK